MVRYSQGSIKRAELAAIVRQSASVVIWSNEKRNLRSSPTGCPFVPLFPRGGAPHQRVSVGGRPRQIAQPLPHQNMTLSAFIDWTNLSLVVTQCPLGTPSS
ncbi:uncharacterized protein TNCV_3400451 [Trichonephila clavipes]|nr:uncharacterized protein TNCV_3400451 [Trichonephila clavipes]